MPYTSGDAMHDSVVIPYQSFGLDEKSTDVSRCFFLSMGYKKDIFAGFAYKFKPLHK